MERQNPGKKISVNSLDAGTWYWNIEAQTSDGHTVSAAQHGTFQVLSIPLLPAAQNLQPARGHRFTMNDLLAQRSLGFSWQAVRGANAYIFSIFQQTDEGKRQIFNSQPVNRTEFLFENLRILDAGTFIWQVEALNKRANGTIDQRGISAESAFVMDIILPGAIQVEGMGVLE